ncbi:S41 family peptidase [uncultured Aquimarina sp.]|uniref:S41 family peptidase n=1 Tax=uncultured Aquimarina sp. TaxID=575652 RepID=UPI00260CA44B|nr:S41 family peptidase [uncultured Aquimarina sp.]
MKFLIALITFLLILSCSTKKSKQNIRGHWIQEGYGTYLEINDSTYKMYDITKISCQPSASGSINNWSDSLETLLDLYKVVDINSESMVLKYGITSYKFNKLTSPLSICNTPVFESNDPKLNFDIFWHTFKENYAYSEIRNIDWDAIYDKHKGLITEKTTQVELFGYIAEILDAIKDEHISLRAPDSITNAYLAIRDIPEQEEKSSTDIVDQQKKNDTIVEHKNPRTTAMSKIISLFPETKFQSFHKDLMLWGKIVNDVGYLQINSMNGYSETVVVDKNIEHDEYWDQHWELVFNAIENGKTLGQYLRDEVDGAKKIQKKILSDFSETSGLIIDLRFNPGGTDQVALELLSGFTDLDKKVFTKKVWHNGDNTFNSPIYIPKSPDSYSGKIVVLTSTQTGSSAETFVLASRQLNNFTQVGSNTMGIFSDVLQKRLPNGWSYGLSNEIYETENGKNYEYIGIPPHKKVEYPKNWYQFHSSIIELNDNDPAINLAISVLKTD